ncbi:MAG: hypothetical protein ABIZ56_05275 [Chthoniobacteraceae bacterium]
MRFEESLHVVVVADHMEVEQPVISREGQALGEPVAAFIETFSEGVDAGSAMRMRIAKGISHRLDQFADLFPLRLRESTQSRQ